MLIPICDGECTTTGGSNATYHVIRVVAFYLDYMSDQNSGQNLACQGNGTTLVPIAGNGAAAPWPAGSSATSRRVQSRAALSREPARSASSS